MTDYVNSALFIYKDSSRLLIEELENNEYESQVFPVLFSDFLSRPATYLQKSKHVIATGSLNDIKAIIKLSIDNNFSLGLIPDLSEKKITHVIRFTNNNQSTYRFSLPK